MNLEELKRIAAEKAVSFIEPGMIIGLGTGSTTKYALLKISEKLKSGELHDIVGIPTSVQTEKLAGELEIPVSDLNRYPHIDLTIDGADEVDKELNLIKGGGGALLREKVVAQASKAEIIIVDESKLSNLLGEKWAVPVEVLQFAMEVEKDFLISIGGKPELRKTNGNKPYITDEGNFILDTNFGTIENPAGLAKKLEARAGIVEHGLFINIASKVIVAKENGVDVLRRSLQGMH